MKIQSLLIYSLSLLVINPAARASEAGQALQSAPARAKREKAPSAREGVAELKFSDFFSSPIGPRGLNFSEKVRSLDGKHVRILGFMVRQEKPAPGMFLLAPVPVQTDEDHYGAADDLPPTTLHVLLPEHRNEIVRYERGLLRLTGRLTLGPQEQADGRIAALTLNLDASHWMHGKSRPLNSGRAAQQLPR